MPKNKQIRFAGELVKVAHTKLVSLDRATTVTIRVPTAQFDVQMSMLTPLMSTAIDVTIEAQDV